MEVNVRPDEREGEEPVSAPREAAMQGFNKAVKRVNLFAG